MSQDQEKSISRVLKAIDAIKLGQMVIMVDDEDRENEGDLVFAAEFVDPAKVNFMVREARGLVCLTLDPATVDRLHLPLMSSGTGLATAGRMTAFTVSIEARRGVSTGISAHDRAETIRVAINPQATPDDIVVPGHIFPLRAVAGGVLERAGHTEGSVDLCRLAGLRSAAVICEIMKDDGSMARRSDLDVFAERHGLVLVSIADVIQFRLLKESLVEKLVDQPIQTSHGIFRSVLFRSLVDGTTQLALVKGEFNEKSIVEVRVHQQRPLLDVFAHRDHGPGARIDYGLEMLRDNEHAVLLYLQQMTPSEPHWESDLSEMVDTSPDEYAKATASRPPMDSRLYGTGAQILRSLGVRRMTVHVSTPRTMKALTGFGLEIVGTKVIS